MYLKVVLFFLLSYSLLGEDSKVFIKLKSNDLIVGTLVEKKFKFKSDYGQLDVSADKIHQIFFAEKSKIVFSNKDQLEAVVLATSLSVDCELGRLKISLDKISALSKSNEFSIEHEMTWTEINGGLQMGVRLNKSNLKKSGLIVIHTEIVNTSKRDIDIGNLNFCDSIYDFKNSKSAYGDFLLLSNLGEKETLAVQVQDMNDGVWLAPGAKIIIDYEVNLVDYEVPMSAELASVLDDELPIRIPKLMHFVQRFKKYSPKGDKNEFQVVFRKGNKELLRSPKLKVVTP